MIEAICFLSGDAKASAPWTARSRQRMPPRTPRTSSQRIRRPPRIRFPDGFHRQRRDLQTHSGLLPTFHDAAKTSDTLTNEGLQIQKTMKAKALFEIVGGALPYIDPFDQDHS